VYLPILVRRKHFMRWFLSVEKRRRLQ
jgi:hypothetical protein